MKSFRLRRQLLRHYLASFRVFCARGMHVDLKAAINDLPSPELFQMELEWWKARRYPSMESELRPASPAMAIKECDTSLYPTVSVLLKIECTNQLTPCKCDEGQPHCATLTTT